MPRKKSKPWDTFGKGRPGWDAYITPYVGNDYQKFCKALVPHMRSDKPDDDLAFVKTLGPVNLAVSLASPSFSLPEEGTTRRPTVTTLIVPLYMEAMPS